jgi:deoxycytidylate deaminase
MVDSRNARCDKFSYFDWRLMKKEMRDSIVGKHADIVTSEYFQNFDVFCPKNMNNTQEYFLNIASKIAMKSVMNHKHGAIVVYKNKIISSGYNYYFGDNSIHAEIAAITKINKKFKKCLPECELYVVRIGTNKLNHLMKYSKPCHRCQCFIEKRKIGQIYYSTNYSYDIAITQYLDEKKNNL